MTSWRTFARRAVSASALLLIVACGGDDTGEDANDEPVASETQTAASDDARADGVASAANTQTIAAPAELTIGEEVTFSVDTTATMQVALPPGSVNTMAITAAATNIAPVGLAGGGLAATAAPGATEQSEPVITAVEDSASTVLTMFGQPGDLVTVVISTEPQSDIAGGGDAPAIITDAPLIAEGTAAGVLGGTDREDVFRLTTDPGDILTLSMTGDATNITSISGQLEFNGERRASVSANAGGTESDTVMLNTQEGGDWYVRVSGSGTYGLTIDRVNQNDGGSGTDAGDEAAAATPVSAGTIAGYMGDNDTADFYAFDLPAGAALALSIDVPAESSGGIHARILVNGSEELRVGASPGGTESKSTVLTNEGGSAFIELWGAGQYELDLSVGSQDDGGTGGDAGEDGEAALVTATEFGGQLGGPDSEDHYRFEATGNGSVSMTADTATGTFTYRLMLDGSELGRATAGPGSPGVLEYEADPGTALTIEIWNADGPYQISIDQ